MKLKKRLTSLALSLSVAASLFTAVPITVNAAEATNTPDKAILENILNGDRHFVIDTLIGDSGFHTDFSTNPHALVNYIGSENTMMDNVLSQYQNKDNPNYSATYKAAVDVMEKVYNSDEYAQTVADFVTEFGADLLSSFSTDAANFASDLTYSKSQLNYESILKEALASDYTASDGTELSTKEIELENLERLEKGLKCLKAFQAFALSYGKANNYDEKDENFKNKYDYFKTYLTSYSNSIEKALSSFEKVMKIDDADEINTFLTLMGTVAQYDLYCEEIQAVGSDIPQYAATYFVSDDDLKKMKFDKSVISGVSNTLSSYMFINSIATQRDSISDTLTRMSQTANPSLKPILVDFASEVGNAGDAKLMGYQTLMKTLRDESAVIDFSKWSAKKITDKFAVMKKMKKEALNSALGKTISSATAVAGISSWCADKAASFGDTCKKTYELKYLRTLIAQTVTTYKSDISVYNSDKTEENAGKVLDDLLMLQKLRLRGEKIAYDMTQGQWNSPLGRLLASGTLSQDKMLMNYLDEAYQARVDAFIGASAMPFSTDSITVGSGEQLTIEYDSSCGGLVGRYTKADKTMYGIGELQYKIANGVTVNSGGTLLTISTSNNCNIPFINNNGGTVLVSSNTQGITEFSQGSGTLVLGSGTFDIGNLYLSGGEVKSSKGAALNGINLITSNAPSFVNTTLSSTVSAEINGTISAPINIYGDLKGSSAVQNITICGSGTQYINGGLSAENLVYANSGTVRQSGTITVNKTVKNTSSKVVGGQNTVLKSAGSIIGNHYNGGLTLDGVTVSDDKNFGGSLYTQNTVNLSNVSVNGTLAQQNGTLNISGNAAVTSDCAFNSSVDCKGTLKAGGDINVSGANAFEKIITTGKTQQAINGTINVNDFTNLNTKGLKINNTVNVSNTLTNTSGKIQGMGMTLLSGGSFGADTYDGDITILSTCTIPKSITGNAIINANESINRDTVIGGYLNAKSNISITDSCLSINGDFANSATINIDENSVLQCNKRCINNSTINGAGALISKGIFQNSGIVSDCSLTLSKEVANSGTMNVKSLTATNEIYNQNTLYLVDLYLNTKTFIPVSGNKINTENLYLSGGGKIVLNTDINVSGKYENSGCSVNDERIIISSGKTISEDRTYKDLNVTTDLILDNCTVTADRLNVSGSIILTNGAKLIINKRMTATGDSSKAITIDETSQFIIKKVSSISSYSQIKNDGILIFGSDTAISSGTILGIGTITLNGDFYASSVNLNKPKSVNIIGKTPQVITCSNMNFDNLNIDNTCRGGVTFNSAAYCYGELNTNNSKIIGTVTQK